MISKERLAEVAQNRNPEYLRQIVVSHSDAGLSYLAIAKETGLTKGVVAGIVYRARKAGVAVATTRTFPNKRPARAPAPAKPASAPKPAVAWNPARISLMELRSGLCRWPLWADDPPMSEKFYCGDAAIPDRPYCPHCYSISIAAPRAVGRAHFRLGIKTRKAA